MGRLMWPNLEVTFFVSFSTGLLQCAASVLGATFAGYATSSLSLVTCIMTLTFIVVAYAWQCYRLVIFLKCHNDDCWQPAEAPKAKDGACCICVLAHVCTCMQVQGQPAEAPKAGDGEHPNQRPAEQYSVLLNGESGERCSQYMDTHNT